MIGQFLEYLLMNFEKISAKVIWGADDLYVKIYTNKTSEEVETIIIEKFSDNVELFFTEREPSLIAGDSESGVEILVKFMQK